MIFRGRPMRDEDALRIIDANCNRTREALRVVEDIVRFHKEKSSLARRLKKERHLISSYCDRTLKQDLKGLRARNTGTDPGRDTMTRGEAARGNWGEILTSNFRRAEEGLRVLEEVSKLLDVRLSRLFKRSRFRVYDLEKDCMLALEHEGADD
jgi:thiamine-phosphate pyrophosphorylase